MNLSSIFKSVTHKELVAVDLPKMGSNQHELNGTTALKTLLGTTEPTHGTLRWHYFADDKQTTQENAEFTFYDARAKSADRTGRSEWRFYYYGNFLNRANVGDWLFLARGHDEKLFALVFENNSAWLRAAKALFGVQTSDSIFHSINKRQLSAQQVELLRLQILTELGLEIELPVRPTDEELMVKTFGRNFPNTKGMSAFARTQIEFEENRIDETLVSWLAREEQLFMALERVLIRERLNAGFPEVQDFIDFSLSAHQRRKSRMGFALQNHLAEIFDRNQIRYTPQAQTEGKRKPDFIFPGQREYKDVNFNKAHLTMLGAKSTCKDRWRQILVEASRIRDKHLCTLEAGISTQQTSEMQEEHVTLVVPISLHATYTSHQLKDLLSVADFVELVRCRQNNF